MKLHDVVPTTKGRPTSKVATTTYDNAEAYGTKVLNPVPPCHWLPEPKKLENDPGMCKRVK